MTFTHLQYGDAAKTLIRATRADGTIRVIEAAADLDLWASATSGTWGTIADYVPPYTPIEVVRSEAIKLVNDMAGHKRQSFITWIPGQEMLYLAKEASARAWIADINPLKDVDSYPLLAAEVGITAETADGLAALWIGMADAWRAAAAQIEAVRLGSIKQIEEAQDLATVSAVVASCRAALSA